MILKALYDYYNRCKEYGEEIPNVGYRLRKIAFNIVINEDGSFTGRIEDNRIKDDKGKIAVPRREVVREKPRTSNIEALFLWDKAEYLLNVSGRKLADSYTKKCKKFIEGCKSLSLKYPKERLLKAIVLFYDKNQLSEVAKTREWEEMLSDNKYYFSFKLQGDTFFAGEIEYLTEDVKLYDLGENVAEKQCLVTGAQCQPIRIWLSVFLPKCGTTKPRLISFQEGQGYDSYGQVQGDNSPVGWEAAEKISIALERLLDVEKKQRNYFTIGNRTFLFWASSNSEYAKKVEEGLLSLFGFSDTEEDDPNRKIELVRSAFKSIDNGDKISTSEDKFYILGLVPNSARIAVVYWNETTVHDFAEMIRKHFENMEIGDTRKEKRPYFGLYQMMKSVTLKGEDKDKFNKNLQPNLPETTMKSILQGLPYPYTLFSSCIRRINAEMSKKDQSGKSINPCTITRMAIIKAYINRLNDNNKKLEPMLDKQNNDAGYLCGRLFAVLDRKQEKGSMKDGSTAVRTIRERYMSSASFTPVVVFARAINLAKYYEDKLEEKDKIFFDKLTQEILGKMPNGEFPTHLSLQEQGRFFIGYYQQRQDFFSNQNKESNNQE